MMKKNLAALMMLVAVAGCANSIEEAETFSPHPGVSVNTRDIAVQTPEVSRAGTGQLQVNISVRNLLIKNDIDLEYKYYFVDASGVQVENDNAWLSKRIPAMGMETIEFVSQTSSAADFRVQMRRTILK